jgi:hypothetical protein
MDITQIIAGNLTDWMAKNPHLDTLDKVRKRAQIGFGTVQRAKNVDGNTTIQNLAAIAKAFGRRVEDLLVLPEGVTCLHLEQPAPPAYLHPHPIVREVIALMESADEAGKGMALMAVAQAYEKYRPIKETAA